MTEKISSKNLTAKEILNEFDKDGGKLVCNYETGMCTYYPAKHIFEIAANGKDLADFLVDHMADFGLQQNTKEIPANYPIPNMHFLQNVNIKQFEMEYSKYDWLFRHEWVAVPPLIQEQCKSDLKIFPKN